MAKRRQHDTPHQLLFPSRGQPGGLETEHIDHLGGEPLVGLDGYREIPVARRGLDIKTTNLVGDPGLLLVLGNDLVDPTNILVFTGGHGYRRCPDIVDRDEDPARGRDLVNMEVSE